MMAKAHKLSGSFAAAPVTLIEALPWWTRLGFFVICTYGALVPDWDHHSSTITKGRILRIHEPKMRFHPIRRFSKVRHSAPFWKWITYKLLVRFPFWFVSVHLRALSRLAQAATRAEKDRKGKSAHRMLTHTGLGAIGFGLLFWWATAGIPGPVGAWAPWWGFAMFMGCMAHIAGDMLTPGGCPVLWPAKFEGQRWHMFSARLFKTDSMIERLMVVPILYFLIGFVWIGGFLTFYAPTWLPSLLEAL